MLNWFACRMKEARDDEQGFTLIELLVVVVIIGILAAIAIPTFLNQRTKSFEATTKSDVRSALTANEALYTQTGAYATADAGVAALQGQGYRASEGVTLSVLTPNADAGNFCLRAANSKGGATFYASDTNRSPSPTACG